MAIQINGSTGVSGVNGTGTNPVYSGGDSDTGIFFPALGQVAITTNGVQRLLITETGDIQSASVLSFPAGSASAPSIAFTGDTDTGLYSPSANSVAISTGGSGRLFVDASGRLGIGTSSPNYTLDVAGTINANATVRTSNGTHIGILGSEAFAAGVVGVGSTSNHPLVLGTNSLERLRITSAGFVGIGTSSPTTNVHIGSGVGGADLGVLLSRGATTNFFEAHDGTKNFIAGTDSSNAFVKVGSLTNHPVAIVQSNAAAIYIDTSKQVGIGTTSPTAKLTVFENTGTGAIYLGDFSAPTANQNPLIRIISRNATNTTTTSVDLYKVYQSGFSIINNDTDVSNFTSFNVGSSERLRITSAGLVGIGTSSPGDLLTLGADNPYMRFADTNQGGYARIGSINGSFEIDADAGNDGLFPIIQFKVGGSERARIDSSGRVGIGTTSPTDAQLYVNSSSTYGVRINHATLPLQSFLINGTQAFTIGANSGGGGSFYYGTGNIEAARIDSSGRLLIGTSTARSNFYNSSSYSPRLQLGSANNGANSSIALVSVSGSAFDEPNLVFAKSRGSAIGNNTIVASGDDIGNISFQASDGSEFVVAANILAEVDGTPGANDMPGRLVFSTTADGASSPTERMRITNDGKIGIANNGVIQQGSGIGGGSAAGILELYNGGTGNTTLENTGAFPILFKTNGSERLRITSAGLVGIGTSSPGFPFQVKSTTNAHVAIWDNGGIPQVLGVNDAGGSAQLRLAGQILSFTGSGGAGSEHMRLDALGRLGIGTTSPGQALSVAGNISSSAVGTNYVASSSQGVTTSYLITDTSGGNIQVDGAWPIRFTTNSNERARIDSSGRLLVGTSTGSYKFQINALGSGGFVFDDVSGTISNTFGTGGSLALRAQVASSSGGGEIYLGGSTRGDSNINSIVLSTANTERMKIGQNGYIQCSETGTYSPDGGSVWHKFYQSVNERCLQTYNTAGTFTNYALTQYIAAGGGTGSGFASGFSDSGSIQRYIIFSNGNIQNTNNSYGAISDLKLKENIVDASEQWNDIKNLRVRKYNLKQGGAHTQIGVIAQEIELVSPGLVYETTDRDTDGNDLGTVTKSVNYSVLYMKAVKALQEAMERIETLEAENAHQKASLTDILSRISALEGA